MNLTILITTTIASGLMAGLFYSWSISVTAGISKINDSHYLHALQKMNRAIINPFFLICFMGLLVLLPLSTYLSLNSPLFNYVLISTMLYILGVITITFFGNIPLNNKLDSLKIDKMTDKEMASFRNGFEKRWNSLNLLRTISSILAFASLVIACTLKTY